MEGGGTHRPVQAAGGWGREEGPDPDDAVEERLRQERRPVGVTRGIATLTIATLATGVVRTLATL